jgi:hypothetical protein
MRKSSLILAAIALVLLAVPVAADVDVRSIERSFEVDSDQQIILKLPLGEVEVVAGDQNRVEIEIVVTCGNSSARCRSRAEEIRLEDANRSRSLILEIEGYSNKLTNRPGVEVRLRIPADSEFRSEVGVGSMRVENLTGDVSIEVGVGDVRAYVDPDRIGSIRLEVGVGSAEIRPEPRDQWSSGFLFLGNEVYWDEGAGKSHIRVDVGVGEAMVRLD